MRRVKFVDERGVYHCMSRTVNGEMLFGDGDKEVLRRMLWRVADFSGVRVLTYCLMNNHFHVLVEVSPEEDVPDAELMRRYRVLYPKPTKYQEASVVELERVLSSGGEEAEKIRRRLRARMGDVSEYMKTLKQRFSVWYNGTHGRYGTLWSERFKSVLVEGRGHPLQTMAAYIDLNPVRAGLVGDPKDYRFCGYAEAVAGWRRAQDGLEAVWSTQADGSARTKGSIAQAMREHRLLVFAQGSNPWSRKGAAIERRRAVKVLEDEEGELPKAAVLRCRVRYFSDGVALGTTGFIEGLIRKLQSHSGRAHPPQCCQLRGADWGNLAVVRKLRRQVFG